MKILVVKMSSLGDIIHALPAVSDAADKIPGLQVDWVVEQPFAEIPKWHSHVNRVIPIALRRWRKNIAENIRNGEIRAFLNDLRNESYDYIIDAQGLLKSAVITRLAIGKKRCGYDSKSARESMSSLFYQDKYRIDPSQHVVPYIRQLFSQSLGYRLPETEADFGINLDYLSKNKAFDVEDEVFNYKNFWVFLHGTSNANKEWPLKEWVKLAELAVNQGLQVYLPWGNAAEEQRAREIAASFNFNRVHVLPKLRIGQIAQLLSQAKAVVGLDTGFSHIAAALRVPTLAIFRASNPNRVCITGSRQQYLEVSHEPSCKNAVHRVGIYDACACFKNIEAESVFEKMFELSTAHS